MELLSRGWDVLANAVSARDVVLLLLRLTLIGALAHFVLALMPRASAAARHLVAVAALAVLALTPFLGALSLRLPAVRVPVAEDGAASRYASLLGALEPAEDPSPAPAFVPAPDPAKIAGASERSMARRPASTVRALPAVPAADEAAPVPPAAPVAPARPEAAPLPFVALALDWPALLVLLTLAGAIAMLAVRELALVATLWIARRARPVDDPRIRRAFEAAVARLRVREPVALLATDHLDVPAVVPFPRPRLLLPAAALAWDDARLDPVLVHELAHVQRRDGFGFAVGRIATALLWFHPLAWTLARVARQECERACDDVVLAAGVRASDYADQLLSIAKSAGRSEKVASMSLAFARPSSLEGRLLSILRPDMRRSPLTRRTAFAVGAVLVLLLLPLATVRVVAEPYGKSTMRRTHVSTTSRIRTATVTRTGWAYGESAHSAALAASAAESAADGAHAIAEAEASASASSEACAAAQAEAAAEAAASGASAAEGSVACNSCGSSSAGGVSAGDSKSGEAWYEQAKCKYDAKEFADAGEAYEQAANAGCATATAWYNAACSWSLAGQKNRAVGALHEAIDQGFSNAKQISSDGDFAPIRGDRRFQLLLQASMHGNSKEWKDEDGNDRDDASIDDSDDVDDLRSNGIELMRSGDPRRAAKLFQRQFAIDSSASALYNTACAYSTAGDDARALDFLQRAIYAGYTDRSHMLRDDDLRGIRGTYRFRELADLAGDLDFKWPSNGFDNALVGPWRMVLPKLRRAAQDHPDAGPAWFNLGLGELRSEHPDASRAAYLRALSLGYRVKSTQYNLACAAAQAGDLDEAFRRLDLAEQAGMDLSSIAPQDDDLDPLRDDPRFDRLMDRIDEGHHYRNAKATKHKNKYKS